MIEEALFPVRRIKSRGCQGFRDRVFEGLHPFGDGDGFRFESGKKVDMVRHDHVPANPNSVLDSTQPKLNECGMYFRPI